MILNTKILSTGPKVTLILFLTIVQRIYVHMNVIYSEWMKRFKTTVAFEEKKLHDSFILKV